MVGKISRKINVWLCHLFVAFVSTTDYTSATPNSKEDIKVRDEIEKALEKVRPMLQRDGGSVELVDVVGSVVKVRLTGACHGCPMSQMTLKTGIERIIRQEVPAVTEVVAV